MTKEDNKLINIPKTPSQIDSAFERAYTAAEQVEGANFACACIKCNFVYVVPPTNHQGIAVSPAVQYTAIIDIINRHDNLNPGHQTHLCEFTGFIS